VAHNPFYHRGPVRESSAFFDRQQETHQIADLLRVSQSISIVGPRRIGKTSLLYHLRAPEVRAAHGLLPPKYVFASANAEGMSQASLSEVYAMLLDALHDALCESGLEVLWNAEAGAADYRRLNSTLKVLSQHGTTVAFFVDEFELLACNHNLDPSFFSGLRGLATRYAVSYVVTSQRPLISLVYADQSVLSSPFFNVFVTLALGLFAPGSARDMLTALLASDPTQLPEPALEAVLELAGPHPFFLQVAAYHAYELASAVASPQACRPGAAWSAQHTAQLADAFYAAAQPHYLYAWHNLSDTERYVLANLALAQHDPGAQEALHQLQQQCLVLAADSGYDCLSLSLLRFVRSQQVQDLLQAGPLVLDLRHRAATAGAEMLKLTKTQFDLLAFLAQRPGQVATNRELEESVWRDEYVEDPERLKAAIKHLRRAMGPWGDCIVNERGVGYALRVPPGGLR